MQPVNKALFAESRFRWVFALQQTFVAYDCCHLSWDWKATHVFMRPSQSLQFLLVGRQVKCQPVAAGRAAEQEVCGFWHISLISSQRSRVQTLRTCSWTISYQRDVIMANGILNWPDLGALAYSIAQA